MHMPRWKKLLLSVGVFLSIAFLNAIVEQMWYGWQVPSASVNTQKSMEQVFICKNGKFLALRTECVGTCGRVFQAVAVAVPPTIREA